MRTFLLWTMLLLVVVVAGIVIGATVCGKPEAMLLVLVPAVPILPLLLVYLLLAAHSANKQRHQGMVDAAERLGFLYTADVSSSLLEESAGFHLTAGPAQLSNEIRGEHNGVSAVVFTCCIRCVNGHCRYAAAALLPLHTKCVPEFLLTPKTVADRLRGALGGQDIEFNGSQLSETFSGHFAIQSKGDSSKAKLRAFFDESRMTSLALHDSVSVEVVRGSVMVWHEVGIGEELRNGFRPLRVNVANEAVTVFQQAMEIRAALVK